MLITMLVLLVVLWLFGYVQIPNLTIPDVTLFAVNGHGVTLLEVLIFSVIPSGRRHPADTTPTDWLRHRRPVGSVNPGRDCHRRPGFYPLVLAIIVGLIAAVLGVLNPPRQPIAQADACAGPARLGCARAFGSVTKSS
jgi:hypothetical protein